MLRFELNFVRIPNHGSEDHNYEQNLQVDHSGCVKPPVDIKTKVPFNYEELIPKRNICISVNGRFVTT